MNMQQIKDIARARDLRVGKMKKVDLVRAIQQQEGNPDCFQTDRINHCHETGCLWRDDCSV